MLVATPQTASHQAKFDMLRGIASVAVLVPHVIQIYIARLIGSVHPAVLIGGTIARHAVLIFFLLSGYLVTQSILSNVARHGSFNMIEYLTARIARIYPPLIGAIVIVLMAWIIIIGFGLPGSSHYGIPGDLYLVRYSFTVNMRDIVRALLMENGMLNADGPLWSLYVEFHLYIAAMFLVMAMTGSNNGRKILCACVAIGLLVFWAMRAPANVLFMFVWFLGSGVALTRHRLVERGAIWLNFLSFLVAMFLVCVAILTPATLSVGNSNEWIASGVQLGTR